MFLCSSGSPECLLNVGSASPVMASIHAALVSTSCWRDCVHIAYNAPIPFKCWPESYTMAGHRTNACYNNTLPAIPTIPAQCFEPRWVNVGPPSVTLANIQRDAKQDSIQRWRWPLAKSPNAKIFAMWRKIFDVFSHSGEDKNEMLLQYLSRFRGKNRGKNDCITIVFF